MTSRTKSKLADTLAGTSRTIQLQKWRHISTFAPEMKRWQVQSRGWGVGRQLKAGGLLGALRPGPGPVAVADPPRTASAA